MPSQISYTQPERWAHPMDGEPRARESGPARTLAAELLPLAQEAEASCRRYEARQLEFDLAVEYAQEDDPEADHGLLLWSDAELQTELELAQRVAQALTQRPGQLAAMDAYCDFGLVEWVSACAFQAAENGHLQTAVALFDDWDQLTPEQPAEQLGSRARLLLCGGQKDAARSAAQARLLREPENLAALEAAADIYQQCGDLEAAELVARKFVAVARQGGDASDLSWALYTLADVLHDRGDREEADALEREAVALPLSDADEDGFFDVEDSHHCSSCGASGRLQTTMLPVVRSQPKIGRNQPCPCGSGAKYKKCCGR